MIDHSHTEPDRNYLVPPLERLRRHVRTHINHALLGGISTSAVIAGFMNATGVYWPLVRYIEIAAAMTVVILTGEAITAPRYRYLLLMALPRQQKLRPGRPVQLKLMATSRSAPVRRINAARSDDPIYTGGFRAICGPSEPLIIIASNRRDISKEHELLFPLFATGSRNSQVRMDLSSLGVPLAPYSFQREMPEGNQDPDHTLAIKDLIYLPELGRTLLAAGASPTVPLVWPEHCVDPLLLADRDVIVVGGPDTNFWHGALFEPVAQDFSRPRSSIPLAMDLRDASASTPVYGSRILSVRLVGLGTDFPSAHPGEVQLDERIYPAYGMLLACRNPFAAARGNSRWCVFVAGTRSLGTSGGVWALAMLLDAMAQDPSRNFFSVVPTADDDVYAPVSALLYRTREVERAVIRRNDRTLARERRLLAPEGLDHGYSDTYVPTAVEYLSYGSDQPRWQILGQTESRTGLTSKDS